MKQGAFPHLLPGFFVPPPRLIGPAMVNAVGLFIKLGGVGALKAHDRRGRKMIGSDSKYKTYGATSYENLY